MDQANQGSLQVLTLVDRHSLLLNNVMELLQGLVTLLNTKLAQLSSQVTQPPAASPKPTSNNPMIPPCFTLLFTPC